jgi:formylglycine-generating enzyme required for sulfatase activity
MAGDYLNFDLRIWKGPKGYQGSATFPDSGGSGLQDIPAFHRSGESEVRGRDDAYREIDLARSHPKEAVLDSGRRLFETVFHGRIRSFWHVCRERARQSGKGIRLRLILQSPELWDWPWEFLCDQDDEFLVFSPDVSVVRCPEVPQVVSAPRIERPVQVLVAMAQPRGTQELCFDRELETLKSRLATLSPAHSVKVRVLQHANRATLRRELKKPVHIFHFIGHGSFDRGAGKGFLLLEKDDETERMTGRDLGQLLKTQPALSLVVLNACESGRAGERDPFSGVAQGLVRTGIAAVLAMQFRVADEAALLFTEAFYEAFVKGDPLDRAVYEARESLLQEGFEDEWGNPVLYLRSEGLRVNVEPSEQNAEPAVSTEPQTKPPEGWWKRYRRVVLASAILVLATGVIYWKLPPHPFVRSDSGCPSPPDLDMPFALVPAGSVTIGDVKEGTSREVRINKPYCMDKFEVTQRQWKALMPKNPSGNQGDSFPVEKVSLQDAQTFVRRLNENYPTVHCWLPNEAEWMRAVGAGGGSPDPEEMSRFGNCDRGDPYDKTAPVASFKPNKLGIYDLYGNVSEWVNEGYEPPGGGPVNKAVRLGGSFNNTPKNCANLYRTHSGLDYLSEAVGFRVVCDVVP